MSSGGAGGGGAVQKTFAFNGREAKAMFCRNTNEAISVAEPGHFGRIEGPALLDEKEQNLNVILVLRSNIDQRQIKKKILKNKRIFFVREDCC